MSEQDPVKFRLVLWLSFYLIRIWKPLENVSRFLRKSFQDQLSQFFLLNYAKHDRILTGYIRILNGSCDDFTEIFFRIQVSRFFVDVSSVLLRNLMKVLENIDASLQQVYFKIVVRNNTECSPGSWSSFHNFIDNLFFVFSDFSWKIKLI
jgi:hypothetical protein